METDRTNEDVVTIEEVSAAGGPVTFVNTDNPPRYTASLSNLTAGLHIQDQRNTPTADAATTLAAAFDAAAPDAAALNAAATPNAAATDAATTNADADADAMEPKEQRAHKKRKKSSTELLLRKQSHGHHHHHHHGQSNNTTPSGSRTHHSSRSGKKNDASPPLSRQPSIHAAFSAGGLSRTPPAVATPITPRITRDPQPATPATASVSTMKQPSAAPGPDSMEPAPAAPPKHIKIQHLSTEAKSVSRLDLIRPSPLDQAQASTSTPVASYSQAMGTGNKQYPAPNFSTMPDLPAYNTAANDLTEATQTSTHLLTFKSQEDNVEFLILPQALTIWRQARSCFCTAEKAKLRSIKLNEWAKQRLVPEWAVGRSPFPQQYNLTESTAINRLGERLRMQATETLFIMATCIREEHILKEQQGHALHQSLQTLYADDPEGLKKLEDIISKYVKKDAHNVMVQLNKQEATMRAAPNTARDIYLIRNPPPQPQEDRITSRGQRRRSYSRSPRRGSGNYRKRARSNSRGKSSYRGNSRRRSPNTQQQRAPRNRDQTDEDRTCALFRKFLRAQNK